MRRQILVRHDAEVRRATAHHKVRPWNPTRPRPRSSLNCRPELPMARHPCLLIMLIIHSWKELPCSGVRSPFFAPPRLMASAVDKVGRRVRQCTVRTARGGQSGKRREISSSGGSYAGVLNLKGAGRTPVVRKRCLRALSSSHRYPHAMSYHFRQNQAGRSGEVGFLACRYPIRIP